MRAGLVLAGAALVALAGCGSSEPDAPAKPAAAPPAKSVPAAPAAEKPTAAEDAFLKALAKVDKQLAADDDALDYGANICRDVEQGKTDAQVLKNAAGRFEVETAVAKKVVTAAKSTLCGK